MSIHEEDKNFFFREIVALQMLIYRKEEDDDCQRVVVERLGECDEVKWKRQHTLLPSLDNLMLLLVSLSLYRILIV